MPTKQKSIGEVVQILREEEAQSPSITQQFHSDIEHQIKQLQSQRNNLDAEARVAQEEANEHALQARNCYNQAREARRRKSECEEAIMSLKLVNEL